MAHRLFEGKEHAASYQKYRVSPPDMLIGQILAFLEKKEGAAEEMPFPDSSVDLLTAMTAAHWFDAPGFLREADRLLSPRGCLALLSYTMDMELQYADDHRSQRLNEVCKEFYAALLPYRNAHLGSCSVTLYKHMYESILYPEKEWNECLWVKSHMPLRSYMGLVESFSSYQTLLKKDPEQAKRLSQDIMDKLLAVMGVSTAETEVAVAVKYFYVLACKPAE